LPLADDSVDGFYGCHVFEHVRDTLALMAELHRVAKPDARMILRLPYGSSDDAMEDPTHARTLFLKAASSISASPPIRAPTYGYRGDWAIESVKLVLPRELEERREGELRQMIRGAPQRGAGDDRPSARREAAAARAPRSPAMAGTRNRLQPARLGWRVSYPQTQPDRRHGEVQLLLRFAAIRGGHVLNVEVPQQHCHDHFHLLHGEVAPRAEARAGAERHGDALRGARGALLPRHRASAKGRRRRGS
jgi:hypothetical protein